MPISTLTNTAESQGYVNAVLTSMTQAVTVQLVEGLTIEKTADKVCWATGNLTFGVKVTNDSGIPYTNVQIIDILDPTIMTLVPNSVKCDGDDVAYQSDPVTGELKIIPSPQLDIADGGTATFTFQVTKVTP